MKKILILLITIAFASLAMGVITGCDSGESESVHEHKYADAYTCHDRTCTVDGCGHVEAATTAHKFADEFTCHDRTCADCGFEEKATTAHKFVDEFTCHDRACTDCGFEVKATTEHKYGEWVTVRQPGCTVKGTKTRECEDCGDTDSADIPATDHKYADNHTCHDRTCTVKDCGHVEAATTAHNFGEWVTVKEPNCTEEGLKERTCNACGDKESAKLATKHLFGDDGVCSNCHKDVKEFLIASQTPAATVAVKAEKGRYTISSTDAGSVYAIIPGDILTELKKLGYSELSFTVTNPAPWPADNSNKHKPIKVAADSTANLWNENTAIAFYGWKEFWDAGREIQFKIDLNVYAGRDIHVYTENTDVYPLEIVVDEFIKFDYEDKSEWLFASDAAGDNGEVTYLEGKGWVVKSKGGNWYCQISGKVMSYFIDQGYTTMVVTYVNNLEGDVNTDAGDFIKTHSRMIPLKAEGGNDWTYQNTDKHYVDSLPEGNGGYMLTVDLTDTTHNFTSDNYFFFEGADINGDTVTRAYISDISFKKGEPEEQEDKSTWVFGSASDNGAVQYIEGKGWVMSPVSGSGGFWCLISGAVIQKKIAEGYTKMTIVYANSLEGVENPNEGNFINTESRLYPWKADGSYFADYVSGLLSQYCKKNEAGNYEHIVNLNDTRIDFTKDQYIWCFAADNTGKAITRGYIADIVFEKGEPEVKEDKTNWVTGNNVYWGSVEYIEGKGWIMKDNTDGGEQGQFWCLLSGEVIQKKIAEGYTKMTVIYVNGFDGVKNPNEGSFINTTSKIYPISVSGTIAQYCTETEKDGVKYYEHIIDLAASGIDGTKDIDILCNNKDSEGKTVTRGYIADIVFSK